MSPPPVILLVRCHYCSKQRWPHEIIRMPKGHRCCLPCYEWHRAAIDMLSRGTPPKGCQECGVTFKALEERPGDGNTRMMLHQKDGIYQVLCPACSDRYVVQRRDLYGRTIYGHTRGLR
jgi:hypothetical protein